MGIPASKRSQTHFEIHTLKRSRNNVFYAVQTINALDRANGWALLACTNTIDYVMDRDIRGAGWESGSSYALLSSKIDVIIFVV